MKVYVNGQAKDIPFGIATYAYVVELAGLKGQNPTVTYHGEGASGSLSMGQTVAVRGGMIFNVAVTRNA